MKKVRGSLTIEAALIVPILLFVLSIVMQMGITMYSECKDTAAEIKQEKELEIVEMFYYWKKAGEWLEDGDTLQ